MAKVKMTVAKLEKLEEMRAWALVRFNMYDKKLRELCTHPKKYLVTAHHYSSNTLGSDGYTTYYDECELCGKSLSEGYSKRFDGEGPRYRQAPKKHWQR